MLCVHVTGKGHVVLDRRDGACRGPVKDGTFKGLTRPVCLGYTQPGAESDMCHGIT